MYRSSHFRLITISKQKAFKYLELEESRGAQHKTDRNGMNAWCRPRYVCIMAKPEPERGENETTKKKNAL